MNYIQRLSLFVTLLLCVSAVAQVIATAAGASPAMVSPQFLFWTGIVGGSANVIALIVGKSTNIPVNLNNQVPPDHVTKA